MDTGLSALRFSPASECFQLEGVQHGRIWEHTCAFGAQWPLTESQNLSCKPHPRLCNHKILLPQKKSPSQTWPAEILEDGEVEQSVREQI